MIGTIGTYSYRNIWKVAYPILISLVMEQMIGLTDTAFLGRVGEVELGASAIAIVYYMVLFMIGFGFSLGAQIIIGRRNGEGQYKETGKIFWNGLYFVLGLSGIIILLSELFSPWLMKLMVSSSAIYDAALSYVRWRLPGMVFAFITAMFRAFYIGTTQTKTLTLNSIVMVLSNVVFNYILIFGKFGFRPMGVAGAAIATLVSRITECLFTVLYVLAVDKKLSLRLPAFFHTDRALRHDFFKYGIPIMAGQLVWAVNMFSYSAIMGKLDYDGVIAALSVVGTLNSLSYIVMNGMSGAVGIITGKTIGSGKTEKIREYAYTVQILFLILGVLTGLLLQLLKDPFISLYSISDAAVTQSQNLINVLSLTIVGTCYQAACLFGLVKSGGDVSFVMKNDAVFVFLIVVPSALLAAHLGAAPWLVFLFLKCDQILKCFVAAVKINRFHWMKNLTKTA